MNKSVYPKKRFGQNFLNNDSYLNRIVAALAIFKHDHLIEIGPGLGALTKKLLPHCQRLDAIEIDRDLVQHLQSLKEQNQNLYIHQADVLQFDFGLIKQQCPLRIVGNLPYNISTPLLFYLLRFYHDIQDLHFMLQREVAERIVALPGSKTYGRLSVMLQYHYQPQILFHVPAHAFTPQPKVTSSFIKLLPFTREKHAQNPELFAKLVNLVFTQRRKMLKNSLATMIPPERLRNLNISLTIRPEELAVEEFVELSNIMSSGGIL